MESGPPSPGPPQDPREPDQQSGLGEDPRGPQAPPGPEAPAPQAPPYAPPQAPTPGALPEAPGGAPAYGGPVPPGGWQQPLPDAPGWAGAQLSGWWRRVGAAVVDALILTIPSLIIIALVVAVAAGSDVGAAVTAIVTVLAYIVVALFYAPILMKREGVHNGQTWGKQVTGIRVVRNDEQPVGLGFAFLREFVVKNLLFGFVGGLLFYIPTLLNYLWPLWDDENRCLHDMVVSTHVVRS